MEKTLEGKFYELLNIDNSVMVRFEIRFVRNETTKTVYHSDGSVSMPHDITYVSENGTAWYLVHGGKSDRIVEEDLTSNQDKKEGDNDSVCMTFFT